MKYIILLLIVTCSCSVAAEPAKSKVMQPGGCFVASDLVDKKAFGGFGSSDNKSIPLPTGKTSTKQPYLQLVEGQGITFGNKFEGVKVRLINGGKSTLALPAQDSRIDLIQEAMDKKGQWKPIEYIPGGWCGNSYHQVFLKPGRYWEFIAPRYSGPQPTLIRFKLEISPDETLYSEPYQGGIHPRQFREVRESYP